MKKVLATLILGLSAWAPTVFATAPEAAYRGTPPNHENRMHAADLPQTLVVRRDARNGKITVMHMKHRLPSRPSTATELASSMLPTDNPSAWYSPWSFYWNYNYSYYPYYNYYGYNYYYYPYYSYYTYPYYYSYYSWCW